MYTLKLYRFSAKLWSMSQLLNIACLREGLQQERWCLKMKAGADTYGWSCSKRRYFTLYYYYYMNPFVEAEVPATVSIDVGAADYCTEETYVCLAENACK